MAEDFKPAKVGLSRGVLRTGAVLHPRQPGAKKLSRKYGEKLLCVRYRYDKIRRVRLITVELVEETLPWIPRPPKKSTDKEFVYVKDAKNDIVFQAKVKAAKGFWDPGRKLWRLKRETVVVFNLEDRIVSVEGKDQK